MNRNVSYSRTRSFHFPTVVGMSLVLVIPERGVFMVVKKPVSKAKPIPRPSKCKGDQVGTPEWDACQEKAFAIQPDVKPKKGDQPPKVTFSSGPLKMFGTLFNHPFPLELSITKMCLQGCGFCFATLNKKANKDMIGSIDDPTDAVIKKIQKAHSPGYNPHNLIELCLHHRYGMVFSNNVDPFMPESESKYKLGERILKTCLEYKQPLFIQTKEVYPNEIVKQLIIDGKDIFNVYISISTLNDETAKKYECGKILPSERIRRIQELTKAGVKVTMAMNPYVAEWQPDLKTYFKTAKEIGCTGVYTDNLHFTPKQKQELKGGIAGYKDRCNQWAEFYEDCMIMQKLADANGIKLYHQTKLPDDYYGGNGARIPTWPIDAHWFAEFMYGMWKENQGMYMVTWEDVDNFYKDFASDIWTSVVSISEFAGVLWYSNDTFKNVRDTLGKENSIRNVVRFLYNNPHLYNNFINYYPEVKMLLEASGKNGELEPVLDEAEGDLVYCFTADPKHRSHGYVAVDDHEFIGINWDEEE
jgi:DNA repair photolyase